MAARTSTSAFSLAGRCARNLAAPLRDYLNAEMGGAVAVLAAAVLVLVCANSPWADSYDSVWGPELSIRLGDAAIAMDVRQWVNEGLMAFFFLVVGLEGQARARRRAAARAPAPRRAGRHVGERHGVRGRPPPGVQRGRRRRAGVGRRDVDRYRVRLGALALVAPNGTRLRVRLLTMAVVDDLVALVVIAAVYTEHVPWMPLVVAASLFAALAALRYAPVAWRTAAAIVPRRRGLGGRARVGGRPGHLRPGRRTGDRRLPAGASRPRGGLAPGAVVP